MDFYKNIYLAQINPVVGDIEGNLQTILDIAHEADKQQASLVVFPECCLIGYPAEDLVLFSSFKYAAMQAIERLKQATSQINAALLIGSLWVEGQWMYNAALLLEAGEIKALIRKYTLPNEGVFDELRHFQPAPAYPEPVLWRGRKLGIMVCKDMWVEPITDHLAAQGAELLISINASPYEHGKDEKRKGLAIRAAVKHHLPVIYLNQTGGQDELVFDGGSFVSDAEGQIHQQFPFFKTCHALVVDMPPEQPVDILQLSYQGMMTGLRDYVVKNGFSHVLIGLSGGIDSALTAIVAVDALGAEKVHCVMLPSPYTADISLEDAANLASTLGVRYDILPIAEAIKTAGSMLHSLEGIHVTALARENLQSRLRGWLLMAISNSTGALLLTTGNKSEMATGYATLYGDMCGAYSVLKDVYKTEVFQLSRWRNCFMPSNALGKAGDIMPERIITRPPSAELRENQKDEDSLPPYETLDAILHLMIEKRSSKQEIVAEGFDKAIVEKVARLLKQAEYKRRQAPPGVKLTTMAFGRDWRLPLTSKSG